MPTPAYDANRLASLVRVTRPAFADIFDPLAKQHKGMDLKLLHVLLGPAPRGAPEFLRAFQHAIEHDWVAELVGVLLAAGALHESDEQAAGAPVSVEPQKITQPYAGLPDAARDSAAAEKARRRVCRITVYDEDQRPGYGTGFLVGPQTVLTNWHVIDTLLDPAGRPVAGSAARLHITFDLFGTAEGKRAKVGDDWLVCHSVAHPSERPNTSNAFSCELAPTGFDELLDFAVIRLQSAEGRARGYYTIRSSRVPTVQTSVIVFQHPSGGPLVRTSGVATALWPAGVHTRLRHNANTVSGASGGLVLDDRFELVALHQAGIRLTDKQLINAAIPTCYIAQKEGDEPFDTVKGVDPMWRIAATGAPVFGRTKFQELLLDAVTGRHRILAVRGGPQSGIAFSLEIMKDRLGLTEHCVVDVNAQELPSDAAGLAKVLLKRAGADAMSIAGLPAFETADTAADAWLRDVLFPDFMSRLLAAASPRVVWVVVDDLHKVDLPVTGAVALLQMLLQATRVQSALRMVLLGHDSLAVAVQPAEVAIEDVLPLTPADVARTIEIRAGQTADAEQAGAAFQAQAVWASARSTPGPFLAALVRAYHVIVEQPPA